MKWDKIKRNSWVRFFPSLITKSSKDNLLLYAQGLTYNTLLTIIPLLGLIISLGKSFLNEDTLIQQAFLLLSKYLTAEALIIAIEQIVKLIENLKNFPLGKFSLIFYFLMSLGLLFQLEDVLNHIFLSYKKRSLKERVLFYWVVMTFAPFIIFLPLLLFSTQKVLLHYKLSFYFYFIFLWFFFYLLYIYFPARKVSKKAALMGALFSTLLWYIFSYAFGIYVKKALSYSKLYGSLTVFPIFILFLFINWLIFLIGAEITYLLEKSLLKKKNISLSIPAGLLLILSHLAKKFYQGKTSALKELEKELPYREDALLEALDQLVKKGYIKVKEEEVFFLLPPDKIKLSDILFTEDLKIFIETYLIPQGKNLSHLYNMVKEGEELTLKDLILGLKIS
ncbi:MAG: YhjD/YihY/BrkB family envelope integrity protein [Caldimicrobium sp.]